VAEFVQDVDQGRVIDVKTIMAEPVVFTSSTELSAAVEQMGEQPGGFVVDAEGRPNGLLTPEDAQRVLAMGSGDLASALRSDFETARPTATFNTLYAEAGRGLPLAVVDDNGVLIGALHPREMMQELGRVERLIDGFEREVFM